MKTMPAKIILSVLVSIFALTSKAADSEYFGEIPAEPVVYKGEGSWKSTDENSGNYSDEMTVAIRENDEATYYTKKISIDNKVMTIKYSIRYIVSDLFDVYVQNKKAGWGYCWANTERHCHYTFTTAKGDIIEETTRTTFSVTLYETGSIYFASDKKSITWNGTMSWISGAKQ